MIIFFSVSCDNLNFSLSLQSPVQLHHPRGRRGHVPVPAGPGGGVRAEQDDGGGHGGPHHRGVWSLSRADHRHGQQDQDFERVQLMNVECGQKRAYCCPTNCWCVPDDDWGARFIIMIRVRLVAESSTISGVVVLCSSARDV